MPTVLVPYHMVAQLSGTNAVLGAVQLKRVALFWHSGGLGTVFILSRKRARFAKVGSGEGIQLPMGFGSTATRKAVLLRYKRCI